MRSELFDYELPDASIARSGVEPRDSARLLVVDADVQQVEHRIVRDLAALLRPGDLVVLNDTRVMPARVRMRRAGGGAAEVLLLDDSDDGWWEALVRPSAKLRPGSTLEVGDDFAFEFGLDLGEGRRLVRPLRGGAAVGRVELLALLDRFGEMPLPPYLGVTTLDDPSRYQTVFAQRAASAAAPTAGLHLTDAIFAELAERGIATASVELVVGLGTFRPMTTDLVDDHVMHQERYRVPEETWAAIRRTQRDGGRIVAVGTTVVRTLESAASTDSLVGSTDLFIRRGFDWQVVDLLLTNFHLPRSTLLVMIDAFVGPGWRALYETALAEGYRFLSFGDAMLLSRVSPVGPGDEADRADEVDIG